MCHPVPFSEHGVIKLGHFENIVRSMAQVREGERERERGGGQKEIVFEEVIGCCDKLCVNR